MDRLVTIKASTIPSELQVAVTYLIDNGIKCILKDETAAQVLPVSVELQVAEEDAEKAVDLLIKGGFITPEE